MSRDVQREEDGVRVAVVTGASGGIGEAIAHRLAAEGMRVLGTMRDPSSARPDLPYEMLELDVRCDVSVASCVAEVLRRAGRLDILVNNAGVTLTGALEETSADEAFAVLDTNVLGAHRMTRACLPELRACAGYVVFVGSIAGFLPKPFEGMYAASKHALEAYAETLRFEVLSQGVRVAIVEPGFVKTALAKHSCATQTRLSEYARAREYAESLLQADVEGGVEPIAVADRVAKIVEQRAPRLRWRVGRDARRLHVLRSCLPAAMFEAGLARRFGVR